MLFSVITITKNNPEGFARTRDSVLAQSFKDFEWIVIDGDAEPDDGIYDAMNKGIERSVGAYMIFMNAGDVFAGVDVLERMAPHTDFSLLYGDAIENGHIKPAHHAIAYGMPTHHQAMAFKRSALRYDTQYKIAADYKFVAQTMLNGSAKYLSFPVCVFETGGVSQRNVIQGRREQRAIKRALGIFAPGVEIVQIASVWLKKALPPLYWMARRRFRTSRA